MKSIRDNTRRLTANQPRMVDIGNGIFVKESTAWWMVILSEEHGDTMRNMVGRMLDDIADADLEAHDELPITLQ